MVDQSVYLIYFPKDAPTQSTNAINTGSLDITSIIGDKILPKIGENFGEYWKIDRYISLVNRIE